MSNYALILAGGTGSRMNSDIPKQLIQINGKTILEHSINAFENHPLIDKIFIVASNDTIQFIQTDFDKFGGIVLGGETRAKSSYCGLLEISKIASEDDIVLIHDAARPLVTSQIISDNINITSQSGACTTAILATDTIYISNTDGTIREIPNRSQAMQAQTPQSFKLGVILKAHKQNIVDVTDDAQILFKQNVPVSISIGDVKNIKLTTVQDLEFIKGHLSNSQKISYAFYYTLPTQAKFIREEVFVKEQKFTEEFDEIDSIAIHLLIFSGEKAVATARIFTQCSNKRLYTVGRIAVLKEYRKLHLGSKIMELIEQKAKDLNATTLQLSAQCNARLFYEKNGYIAMGEIYFDEHCEHIHMEKEL